MNGDHYRRITVPTEDRSLYEDDPDSPNSNFGKVLLSAVLLNLLAVSYQSTV
jgi:hypothetical protein